MAQVNREIVRTLEGEMVPIMGSFAPDTADPVTSAKGKGYTVAYTSPGTYTVTFTHGWNDLISATATLQLASADDKFAQIGTYTAATASASATLVIRVLDASGAAVAEVAANANNRVNFTCWFRNKAA
jgi:hypothetical protein